ncbi:MAG: histidine phosphatase family protein [Gammaproteobacteria bacterium]|nr:histidine phosphatase family protein [Gammaproteobacteria bacterium]MDE0367296.1 histidine phosphatase family protein [Gammaproteobacteria bacterium]
MRLWLIRHAKSSWADRSLSDFDRPLNGRGRRDGPRMRDWLRKQAFGPSWIWTSDAARALATAEFVHGAFPGAELVTDHRLYGAWPETILDVVRETPAGIDAVAVVAHNPGMTDCINLLAGERVIDNLPTFGIARLQWFGGVDGLVFGQANLEILMAPKLL